MIRDFVHLIQNKLRHYAVFPSLHSLSRSSAFQTALFLLGVLAFARACIFLAPPSVTTLATASVNGTFMPICRVETDQKKVALTFNCTYSAQDMQQLLEILKEKNVHATFFVSDAWAKNYPELLCTIHNAGHDIGGLWTTQASLSIREQTLTLENLTQRIDRLTDSETTLFRFEDGNYDNSAIRLIQESGGYPVQWNINSMDWKDYGAQDILHRILNSRQLQNGSILLFHAGTVYTAQALPDLIDNLEDQGYQPVPISELIWKHSYYMDADGVQIPKTEP